MDNMNKMKIRLNATADVREFVRAAEKCDFDVDIQYDSHHCGCKIHSWNYQSWSCQDSYRKLPW